MIILQALNYLIDAYLKVVAASAITANTFLQSFFGAGFPLFSSLRRCLIIYLGVDWAGSFCWAFFF
jgi:DHA1 family multidrug resistance protein-like MFS transporter